MSGPVLLGVYALLLVTMVAFGGLGAYLLYGEYRSIHEFLPVDAVITRSEVGVHTGDGTTYSVDIQFTYTVNGTTYTEGRWDWSETSSGGRSSKAEIVAKYPVGTKCTGYYDPEDPSVAVLNREYSLLGIIFLAMGIGVPGFMLAAITYGRRASAKMSAAPMRGNVRMDETTRARHSRKRREVRPWPRYWSMDSQSRFVELPTKTTPGCKAATIAIAALIWNGITWGVIYAIWQDDGLSIGVVAIMSIFALIGLLLVYSFIHQVLSGLKARPARLAVDSPEALLGGRLRVLVGQELKRRTRVDRLKLNLTCKEWVRYTVGTNTRTEEHEVSNETFVVVEPTEPECSGPLTGEVGIDIPPEAMHSFETDNNKIQWLLTVTLEVPRWPDTQTKFPLTVAPRMAIPTTTEVG